MTIAVFQHIVQIWQLRLVALEQHQGKPALGGPAQQVIVLPRARNQKPVYPPFQEVVDARALFFSVIAGAGNHQ